MNLIALSCAAGLAVLPLVAQSATAPEKPDDKPAGMTDGSLRVLSEPAKPGADFFFRKFDHGPHEMESVTFLGVETAPVSETLIAQLALPDKAGLVILSVVPDSPAAGVLQPHDILLKLDDQILIDQHQLSVLVRNHKPGDEVTVTYMRTGKTATAAVKLARHDVPKYSEVMREFRALPDKGGESRFAFEGRGDVDRVLSLIDAEPKTIVRAPGRGSAGEIRVMTVAPENSNLVLSDKTGSFELTIKNGQKTLVAKDPNGAPLFSGPVNTPEQQAAMPPVVREKFEKLERMPNVKFRTDEDFEGGKTFFYQPSGKTIMLRRETPGLPRFS